MTGGSRVLYAFKPPLKPPQSLQTPPQTPENLDPPQNRPIFGFFPKKHENMPDTAPHVGPILTVSRGGTQVLTGFWPKRPKFDPLFCKIADVPAILCDFGHFGPKLTLFTPPVIAFYPPIEG